MVRDIELTAPLEHPCYAGHFPGHPVVPGVVLLDLVVEALALGQPRALVSVKFHRVVRPGDAFTLRSEVTASQVTFRCVDGDELLVEGRLSFDAVPGAAA